MPIRLFLISSYCLLRHGLMGLLASAPERVELVGAASSPNLASVELADADVDVLLLDIDDVRDGVAVLVGKVKPHCAGKILLLTRQEATRFSGMTPDLGVHGLIDGLTPPDLLLRAVEKVHEGQVWLSRASAGRMATQLANLNTTADDPVSVHLASLTDREQKIVATVVHCGGEPGKVIAGRLYISESTLRNHLTSIFEKLGVPNRNGLLAYALQNGLVERMDAIASGSP